MTAKQASRAASAVKALHKMGYYHGDAHALQWMVKGDDVKLVDYGLSGKTSKRPEKAIQDLSKWAKVIGWKNKELEGDPYFKLVNRTMDEYNSITGQSKKAKTDRLALAERYLDEVDKL